MQSCVGQAEGGRGEEAKKVVVWLVCVVETAFSQENSHCLWIGTPL